MSVMENELLLKATQDQEELLDLRRQLVEATKGVVNHYDDLIMIRIP